MNNIVLVGYKCAGKSRYGKLLSEEAGKKFIDTDSLIEDLFEGRLSARQISLRWGEAFFRKLEKDVIVSLQDIKDSIIATGGGAILDSENRDRLKCLGICIYLRAEKSLIKERILASGVPSFLDSNDVDGSFEKMYKQRVVLYKSVCDFEIDTKGRSSSTILESILTSV